MNTFCQQFNTDIPHVQIGKRYFHDPHNLLEIAKDWKPFSVGIYLGEERGTFRPSPALLGMIAEHVTERVVLDEKSAWLFICGRDVLMQGVVTTDEYNAGDLAIVSDEDGNVLGYGKIKTAYDKVKKSKAYVKNLLDIGEYLRRER